MKILEYLQSKFPPKSKLSENELSSGIRWWTRNGLGGQAMDTLTVGAFVTAFALELGASNIVIGLLAGIPHLSQILQIAGVYLEDRWRNRRLISVLFAGVSRPMFLFMAAAAFVQTQSLALALFILAYALRYILTAFMACSWNSWIRDLVPDTERGKITSRRLAWMAVLAIGLGLSAAILVDLWKSLHWGPTPVAYSLLFVGAFIGGIFSTYCMSQMPEPKLPVRSHGDVALVHRIGEPLRDANYRRLIFFIGTWSFAINLAAPFFMVHMLKRLELDLWVIMSLTLVSQIVNVAVLKHWGLISDRFSNKSVLRVCAPLFILCIFAWTFTTFPDKHALTMPLLVVIHVFTGFATAGVTLATGNIAMKLAPRGNATVYLASNSLVTSITAGIAPLVGGLAAHYFTERELTLVLRWRSPGHEFLFNTLSLSQWDFFFVFAALVGLVSLGQLRRVKEKGTVHESLVLNEMYLTAKRMVQNLSSIAGLQQAGELPFGKTRRRPKWRKRKE